MNNDGKNHTNNIETIMSLSTALHRNIIIASQKILWSFLDSEMINKLVNLFDDTDKSSNDKMRIYIENERIKRGLDTSGVTVKTLVYGHTDSNSTLHLEINKNNSDFLHLSIHLHVKSFNPKAAGLV